MQKDAMGRTLLGLAAILPLASGLWMVAMPVSWFNAVAGVSATGPFNAHFVIDVGLAYLVSGSCLATAALRPAGRALALPGTGFLAAHALYHLLALHPWTEVATAAAESVGIYMPVILASTGLLCLRPGRAQ